ncbi:uncharacterized protein LOC126898691 [Daktulosphaira vitifoliae]|uniref:uncharacterized protein LOC126898691 n=1 Tax=Daktulosphaira vitifoliae TaxID=58002 RepID=UPI0021AA13AC|nr:uncharacterized protein LOC126898691 [Daktulosphaira vitifoliae]
MKILFLSVCLVVLIAMSHHTVASDLSLDLNDPVLDALAEGKTQKRVPTASEDDRTKRQLSIVQSKLLNFLKPMPVVDVITEKEKYGNKETHKFGRALISGFETISSKLTSVLSLPVESAKKISKSTTNALNNVGGRLVGLQ